MNSRIQKLREKSLSTVPSLSSERAQLITDFYKSGIAEKVSTPVARALAFKYILEHKKIFIDKNELIVGERGPAPKATPTYPEVCIHSLKDLDILNTRPKISFTVSDKTKKIYESQIIPFWKGRSMRERIFEAVDEEWKEAYEAGIFTEFMEQRAPGHTVLDDKIYYKGFKDFKENISESINSLDFYNDPEALYKREQLKAMAIAADALIHYAQRFAKEAKALAKNEKSTARKAELKAIAEICNRVPENAPRTFYEALQYYWFVHLGVITELNTWDSFNPGRLDQHLYPFYKQDIEKGILTKEKAKELLQAFWTKFSNQPAPPKVGVTAQESATYTDFCLINLGGVKADGSDAVNELTYLILDVIEEMRLLQPSSMVQVSKKNPDRFIHRAIKIIKTGFGQPSVFNTDSIIQEMVRQGKSIVDARNGGASGCVETGAFGKESYILTGYFNIPKVLEITLYNGVDPRTKRKIGVQTGDPRLFSSYEELFEAFAKQLNHFIDIKIKGNAIIERLWATYLPAPFMSLLIDDCIKNGKDYNNGGARYNTSYIQGVGFGSITDALTAIRYNVYNKQKVTMAELLTAIQENYKGYESLRQTLLYDTPKYGNDDERADENLRSVFELYYNAVDGRPNTKGGVHRISLI